MFKPLAYLAAGGDATNHRNPSFSRNRPAFVSFDGLDISSISRSFFTVSDRAKIRKPIVFSDFNGENFNLRFDDIVFGFGFDILEPVAGSQCNVPRCTASTFSMRLFYGLTDVGVETFRPQPGDTIAAFIGIQSTLGFNRVEVRETFGTNDNEFFGNFVSTAAPAPVPLPAAGWMLIVGIGGMIATRRRKKF